MILSQEEVVGLVKASENPVISINKQIQDDHKIHIQGVGFENVLKQIIGYENVEQYKQKKLLTKPFTRPIFKKIINSQSRWKTAQGTSKFYKFVKNSDKLSKEFKEKILSQSWKGGSIDEFIKNFLSKAIYEEFNGFFMVERPKIVEVEGKRYQEKDGIRRLLKEEKALPYIVFVSVDDVYNFKVTGKTVEYIVLKYGNIIRDKKEIILYRVVDDEKDYILEKQGEEAKISEQFPIIDHNIGSCPAVNVSFINRTLTDDYTKTSPVDDIISLLDYYLHQMAEHLVTETLHAHPNYYQTGQRCVATSHGVQCREGRIQYEQGGESFDIACPSCLGGGHNLKKDASTTIILPAKDEEGKAFNITNVAGYVAPPVDALTYQQAAIDWMENKILDAALGINNVSNSDKLEKTATEAMVNLKPLEDIISGIIDIIQGVETTLTNFLGKAYYADRYVNAEIIYGRKLNLRDENTLLKEIEAAKKSGASYLYIKTLVEELVYTRFIRSESDLARNIILIELEPLVGFTYEEVEGSASVSADKKILKQNFVDFIQRFEIENGAIEDYKPDQEFNKRIKDISVVLDGYVNEQDIIPVDESQDEDTNGGGAIQKQIS